MRTFIIIISFFLLTNSAIAQLDSLKAALGKAKVDTVQYDILESIAMYWMSVDKDSALFHSNKMMSIARARKDVKRVSNAYIVLGWCHSYFYEFDKEIAYYLEAARYNEANGNYRGIGVAYQNAGVSFSYKGQLDTAVIYYEKSRPYFELVGDEKNLAYTLNNLGQVYRKTKKYNEAIAIYKESIAIKEKLEDRLGLLNTYLNLSSLYSNSNEFELALKYAQEVISQTSKNMNPDYYISGLVNAGIATKSVKNFDAALAYFREARELVTSSNDVQLKFEVAYNLAELAFEKANYSEANSFLNQCEKYLEDYKNLEAEKLFYELNYKVSKAKGDMFNSLSFLERFQEANEKLLNKQTLERVSELEKSYESEKKNKQITQLELDNQTSALLLAKSENQRNILIAISLLVMTATILLFVLFRQKRKSLAERDILLKEIHHRVKNNLQVISSLLNLQADSLEDEIAADAVKEGQHRVKSMALIHQRLYSADDVRGVNVQEYLENLSSELFKAFGIDQEKVNWKIETSGLKLDIDTVIPLGLIVNELITNSIKYAFQNVDNGLLEISMQEVGDNLNVIVKDNGTGMDEEAIKASNSFGWKMIKSLGRKLKAEISVDGVSGTNVQISISRYKLVV